MKGTHEFVRLWVSSKNSKTIPQLNLTEIQQTFYMCTSNCDEKTATDLSYPLCLLVEHGVNDFGLHCYVWRLSFKLDSVACPALRSVNEVKNHKTGLCRGDVIVGIVFHCGF